ncbi:MAG: nucleotidyltransferase domain-containing protein [Verrucomicrobiae bacterium]|nr:nucleotidyltransferase domain-containing protein [Verrucomicrobiae bacterium]
MTPDEVEKRGWLIFKCISGSRAYGTETARSDTDLRGVFIAPPDEFYGLSPVTQVSDETNDTTYYELGRFIELLSKNNPNVMELLYMPDDCVLLRHPLFDRIEPGMFLSKLCRHTFAGYAVSQVRKARGLNKKIVNPMPPERKGAIDFCHVLAGQGSVPLAGWLDERGLAQENCGLVRVPHMRDVFGLYHSSDLDFRGIFSHEDATEVRCSSVPAEAEPIGWMAFNKDGFKKYCKEYAAYWDWVKNRNEDRYATNQAHGQAYDSKNMMHTIRLLEVAVEIATEQTIQVRRPNREELLKIRRGEMSYEELLQRAEALTGMVDASFDASPLPESPDLGEIERLLVGLRQSRYAQAPEGSHYVKP